MSSVNDERLFSLCADIAISDRNTLSMQSISNIAMIKMNLPLVDILFNKK
jgi:hypothetical protein